MKGAMLLGVAAAMLVPPADGGYSSTITHPYLPLSKVTRAELERTGKKKVVVIRRVEEKTETVAGVECLVLVEEEFVNGAKHEVARNFFAQKDGAVYFFGEDVDNYKNGKVADHDGSWKVGKDVKEPFLFMPAQPKVGEKFRPEDVKGVAEDEAEVLGTDETVDVNGTKYTGVLKIKVTIVIDKEVKTRYYARGVGLIREEEGPDKVLDLKKVVQKLD
jgi:hypothetical protein